MVIIDFPPIWIPGFKITKGQLLDVTLLGVGLVIPPVDITFWAPTKIFGGLRLFNSEWIKAAVRDVIGEIANAVWDLCKTTLDEMAADYYKRHSEGEEE